MKVPRVVGDVYIAYLDVADPALRLCAIFTGVYPKAFEPDPYLRWRKNGLSHFPRNQAQIDEIHVMDLLGDKHQDIVFQEIRQPSGLGIRSKLCPQRLQSDRMWMWRMDPLNRLRKIPGSIEQPWLHGLREKADEKQENAPQTGWTSAERQQGAEGQVEKGDD